MSALLHSVNTVITITTSGDYDRGMGPSQPMREKPKLTCHNFNAEQLGQDLHNFMVELDTQLPSMVNIVEDDGSGCETKHKQGPQKSKLFTSWLENPRRSKHVFKIRNISQ